MFHARKLDHDESLGVPVTVKRFEASASGKSSPMTYAAMPDLPTAAVVSYDGYASVVSLPSWIVVPLVVAGRSTSGFPRLVLE